jgi:hypothetical protein
MSEFKEHLVLITVLIIPLGIWLFEKYYSLWHKEKDYWKRESLSRKWHAIKFWTIFLPALFVFIISGLTEWFRYIPLMFTIGMIWFDLFWNWQNKPPGGLLYPGDGKGGFIEALVFKLSGKWKVTFMWTMVLVKIFLLAISIVIIILSSS